MEEKRCFGCMRPKSTDRFCEHCGYDTYSNNAINQLPVGTVLRDQYLVGRVLGQGGFGITYLGWDIRLETAVAIKEYFPAGMVSRDASCSLDVTVVADSMDTRYAENRERFLREARILARLEDVPEVVQVKNYFAENNTAYIIMGYVKGITLKEYIRQKGGRLTVAQTFHLLRPVMEALDQVHAVGLVHRDISPDNIMLQSNGKLRLIDFGAAHETTRGDRSTEAVLKYGFAPPEQYARKGQLGPWTDVYAMCATVYCCITGKQPPNVTDRLMGDEDFDWDSIPDLTEVQRNVLKKGVAPQYEERVPSMKSLCWGLFGAGRTEIRKGSQKEEPKEPPKPKGRKILPAVIAVAAAVLVLLLVFLPKLKPEIEDPPADTNPLVQTEPEEEPETFPKETEPQQTQPETFPKEPEPTAPAVTGSRILWNPQIIWKDDRYDTEANFAFGTKALRTEVRSVTVLDTVRDAPEDAVDASRDGDGSVLAWVVPSGELYDLYLAATGGVIAPKNCASLFAYFTEMKGVDLTCLDTGDVTDMSNMFWVCQSLTALDLSVWDTGNVKNMQYLFGSCTLLNNLDISGWDTGKVSNMRGMFYNCIGLTELVLTGFRTENVKNMSEMFYACTGLQRLNIDDFRTPNVTDMSFMFEGCTDLIELNVSGFDTSKVENMVDMFCGCGTLQTLDISGFRTENVTDMTGMFYMTDNLHNVEGSLDVGNVKNYAIFMDEGDTFNGSPWEELFQ